MNIREKTPGDYCDIQVYDKKRLYSRFFDGRKYFMSDKGERTGKHILEMASQMFYAQANM